jgi:hypothetical protein
VLGWLGQQAGSGQVRRLAHRQEAGGTQHARIHRPLQLNITADSAAVQEIEQRARAIGAKWSEEELDS